MNRRLTFGVRLFVAALVIGFAAQAGMAQTTPTPTSTPTSGTDITSILQQLTGGSTGTTGSTGTSTGTGSTSTTTQPSEGDFPPLTTGLPQANVGLGALQARAPGTWVIRAQGVATGNVELEGNGDDSSPSATNIMRNMAFDITEAVVQSVQQGILQLFSSFLSQLGVNIPGGGSFVVPTPTINVNGTLDNQTTTSTGTVVPVP